VDDERAPHEDPDRLSDLRGHVDAAYEAADRLVREATERAEGVAQGAVPPRGWDVPQDAAPRDPWGIPELRTLLGVVEALRTAIPPDLAQQLIAALRDLLAAIRALIDWWLDRLERHAVAPPAVEDIPIQ
jgi:hypothetical protein